VYTQRDNNTTITQQRISPLTIQSLTKRPSSAFDVFVELRASFQGVPSATDSRVKRLALAADLHSIWFFTENGYSEGVGYVCVWGQNKEPVMITTGM